ncbi:MAG: hypothetical protein WA889_18215, partial [Xanthobacteraceae bacterium]
AKDHAEPPTEIYHISKRKVCCASPQNRPSISTLAQSQNSMSGLGPLGTDQIADVSVLLVSVLPADPAVSIAILSLAWNER